MSDISRVPSWKGKQPIKVRLGNKLQSIRTSKGFTQMQVAMQAGLDRSFISDIERGAKEPTASTLEALAAAYSMTLSELFDGI